MKNFIGLSAALVFAAMISCTKTTINEDYSITPEMFDTMAAVSGYYSMVEARWDYQIDLSGSGHRSSDILSQLRNYGYFGVVASSIPEEEEHVSILDANWVEGLTFSKTEGQVNLYLPLFMTDEGDDGTILPFALLDGLCSVSMTTYQFRYSVTPFGGIQVRYDETVGGIYNNISPLYRVNLTFTEDAVIRLTADTRMYDYASHQWQKGQLHLVFRKTADDKNYVYSRDGVALEVNADTPRNADGLEGQGFQS